MNTLIRFEDTYGMADLFCLSTSNKLYKYTDVGKILQYNVNAGVFIEIGCSSYILELMDFELDGIKKYGIERIINVLDTDSGDDNKEIISEEHLKSAIYGYESALKNNGIDVRVDYMLTVFSTETIMLYQMIPYNEEHMIYPENFVHRNSTLRFQLLVLAYLAGMKNERRAKTTRNFVNMNILMYNLKKSLIYHPINVNKLLIEWIVGGFSLNADFMSRESIIYTLRDAIELVNREGYYKELELSKENEVVTLNTQMSCRKIKREILSK